MKIITEVLNRVIPARRWTSRWGTSIDKGNVPPTRPVSFKAMSKMSHELQRVKDYNL